MNILEIKNPNTLGEALRERFFTDEGFGCYQNFNLEEDVVSLPYKVVYWDDSVPNCQKSVEVEREEDLPSYTDEDVLEIWTRAEISDLAVMEYFWDGDGTLIFRLPDDRILGNNDCKKSRNWHWIDNLEFWLV